MIERNKFLDVNCYQSITLTGSQRKQFREALLDAFSITQLEITLDELDWKLTQIVGGSNDEEIVYNLIKWAESCGEVNKLLETVKKANPCNQKLTSFYLSVIKIEKQKSQLEKDGENPIYKALLSLNYRDQVDRFEQFWEADCDRQVGCFLIRGDSASGQRWLLNRLLEKSFHDTTAAKKVGISLSAYNESYIEDLWEQLKLELKASSASPQKLVSSAYEYWKNETVIIVFHNLDRMYRSEPKKLIANFWNPLVEKVQQHRNCSSYLAMFLVDNKGKSLEWEIDMATEIGKYQLCHPIDLQPISNFSQGLLNKWVMSNRKLPDFPTNNIQLKNLARDFWENSREGIPELVMRQICECCGSSWSDIMKTLSL
ncbi:MAG: effector-associated domain EAD1-containing protein [Scytonema sp. PMC 1069.18]|nr:effector-associated domain EAD1-containing protein [Scytonema sp. PMC 1069.18]MEC4882613.1 effector-associated domain EAD1-containing protein [Scytonema sp. PMC 1070.18]